MTLREQFDAQKRRAEFFSATSARNRGVAVVMRKHHGERAFISVIGAAISWGSLSIWRARYKILRMYYNGEISTNQKDVRP